MFPSNATARTAQPAAVMISPVASALQIDSDCRQASCHFDTDLFQEDIARQLGLALPASLNSAVQKRKAEFIAGRYCARAALAKLDCNGYVSPGDLIHGDVTMTNVTIGIGAHREPLWPQGFVGSITHTQGYASAVVARHNKVRSLGIDSEMWIAPESVDNVSHQILTASENHAGHGHLFGSSLQYLTLVFSAKESLFKCLFPLVNRFFDFHAAVIIPEPSGSATGGAFRFELQEDLNAEFRAGYSGHGSYSIHDNGVHTAVILKAECGGG